MFRIWGTWHLKNTIFLNLNIDSSHTLSKSPVHEINFFLYLRAVVLHICGNLAYKLSHASVLEIVMSKKTFFSVFLFNYIPPSKVWRNFVFVQ